MSALREVPSLTASPFPLQFIENGHLQKLYQTLWGWDICESCQREQSCAGEACPWPRSNLTSFFDHYKNITSSYVPELIPATQSALRSHEDLFDIIKLLKAMPTVMRSDLMNYYFSARTDNMKPPSLADQDWAFNLAVKIMTSISCSGEMQPYDLLEFGTQPSRWHNDSSLAEFILGAFPESGPGNLVIMGDFRTAKGLKPSITAKQLTKAGLRLKATDDLRNHLKLDVTTGVVEIYHYTGVLKENLKASQVSRRAESNYS